MIPFACESPVRVTLPNGRVVSVPCGHCDACLCQKGLQRTQLLDDAMSRFKFRYFVTLTYDNEHLPLARLSDGVLYHPNDCDYNGVVYSAALSDYQDCNDFISQQLVKFGGLPVLSHRDITNFKKRLRKYVHQLCTLNQKVYEYLFIYACGEYGPTTFRPHYHLLFGTNSEYIGSILKSCVYKAWTFSRKTSSRDILGLIGQIDFQRIVTDGCSGYVARYLNCTTHLPTVLSQSNFRPFAQKPSLRRFCYNFPDSALQEIFFRADIKVNYVSPVNGLLSYIPLPVNVESRLFPKCVGFSCLDFGGLCALYSFATRVSNRELDIYCDYLFNGFTCAYDDIIYRVVADRRDKISSVRALRRLWYISNRVLNNCASFGVSLCDYIKQVLLYYSRKELQKLRNFYELQQTLLSEYSCTLSDLLSLYCDTEDNLLSTSYYLSQFKVANRILLNDLPLQKRYFFMTHKIVNDTTKTKKRNDYLLSKGKTKKRWFPIYSYRITKFMSN